MLERPLTGILVAILLLAAASAEARSGTAPPPAFTRTDRAAVLAGAEKEIGQYTFPEKVGPLRAALESKRTALLQIADPQKFADAVNVDLYAVAHDKHLNLWYSDKVVPKNDLAPGSASGMADFMKYLKFENFEYAGAVRLRGNVGYLKFDGFGPMPQSKTAIDSAMTLLTNTDALIIDLRANEGGDPHSLDYLMGYFYAKPIQLTSILATRGGKQQLHKQFSASRVSGPRYLNKPLYVLTSEKTISCAEQLAYDMQSLHRATLIGMTTAGGANPGRAMYINDHFAIFIPLGRAVNPYTHTNWEGVGVVPDVKTKAPAALLEAYTRALRSSTDSLQDAVDERKAALVNPASALKASLP